MQQKQQQQNEVYLLRKNERVTFPIVKLSPIRIEGRINRIRVEVEGTDKKMYLVDPADLLLIDDKGKVVFTNALGKDNLYNS